MFRKVKCSECDKEFSTLSENEVVCSLKCGQKRMKRLKREQSRVKKIHERFKRYCTECGNRIISYNNIFTCSKKCKHERKLRIQREQRILNPRVRKVLCSECHCFITDPKRRTICSDKCENNRKNRIKKDREGYYEPIPNLDDLPYDIPDDSRWMAERNITIASEWVKHPTGNWRNILEGIATSCRQYIIVQKERRKKHNKLYNRKL